VEALAIEYAHSSLGVAIPSLTRAYGLVKMRWLLGGIPQAEHGIPCPVGLATLRASHMFLEFRLNTEVGTT